MRSKKGGLTQRRRSALQRLEAKYEAFKAAKSNKVINTRGRNFSLPYETECNRMATEIATLKALIH